MGVRQEREREKVGSEGTLSGTLAEEKKWCYVNRPFCAQECTYFYSMRMLKHIRAYSVSEKKTVDKILLIHLAFIHISNMLTLARSLHSTVCLRKTRLPSERSDRIIIILILIKAASQFKIESHM